MNTGASHGQAEGPAQPKKHRWLRLLALVLLVYVGGYFVVMDVHRPTSPYRVGNDHFESSCRWAPATRASKEEAGPPTVFPKVTVWNIIYRPMDKLYFKLFPRTRDEVERLRALGYYL